MLFGSNFYWGTATAAYQVEGGIQNNWTLTNDAGRAVDHYNRYPEDIEYMKQMHNNAYRFSIEWARIEPRKGHWNRREIEHYKQMIYALQVNDLEPFVTMYHFTLPDWFPGWEKKESVFYFIRYARLLFEQFPMVKYWITINEPIIYSLVSYLLGEWVPRRKSIRCFYKVIKNLARAHKEVYKFASPHLQIGFAKNLMYFRKVSFGLNIIPYIWNKWWFKLVEDNYDFIGVNYYLPLDLHWKSLCKASTKYFNNVKIDNKVSDLGWEIYPIGLFEILKSLQQYKKPIFITENGIADRNDQKRSQFIHSHIKAVQQALKTGIDVRGYFYWSLMDNFEWEKGYDPKFGLVAISPDLDRDLRSSGTYYRDLIIGKIKL